MNTIIDFFTVVLASGAIIEVWHKGSIFATARAYVQAWDDASEPGSWKSLLYELILCPFCKSYHIPLYLYLLLLLADSFGGSVGAYVRVPLLALAATRLSNIINGLLPHESKYDSEY